MIFASLPNDNLYKFKAFVGLAILVASITYPFSIISKTKIENIDIQTRIEILSAQSKFDDLRSEQEKNALSEEKEIRNRLERLASQSQRLAEIKGAMKKQEFYEYQIKFLWFLAFLGTAWGYVISRSGFELWLKKVQIPSDFRAAHAARNEPLSGDERIGQEVE